MHDEGIELHWCSDWSNEHAQCTSMKEHIEQTQVLY